MSKSSVKRPINGPMENVPDKNKSYGKSDITGFDRPSIMYRRAKISVAILMISLVLGSFFCVPTCVCAHPGTGIVVNRHGEVFFVDGIRNRIMRLKPDGSLSVFAHDDRGKLLINPHHLVLDSSGRMYSVGDQGGQICRISTEGEITRYYPQPNHTGIRLVGIGGDPFSIDAKGNIVWVNAVQNEYCQLVKLSKRSRIEIFAGDRWGYADGKKAMARFRSLHSTGFAWDGNGNLLLVDNGSRICRVEPDGTVSTIAGGKERGLQNGDAARAQFRASGICVNAAGEIFVADQANHVIRKIDAKRSVTTLAGNGNRDIKDGESDEASFENPSGISLDSEGRLFVLDFHRDDPRVRLITVDGDVKTVASISSDGSRSQAWNER